MSRGVIDTRNFAGSYEDALRRIRLLEQQVSNPDLQIGAGGVAGDNEFDEVIITNPGVGSDLVLGFSITTPTGLSALTSTYLEEVYIDASWGASTNAQEYEIELARRTSPGVYDTPRVYRTAGTSLRLIVPLGGVTYGIRVAGVNSLGIRSAFSARVDINTAVDSTVPPAISGLSVTAALNTLVVTFNRLTAVEAPDMQNGEGIYRVQLSSNDFAAIIADKYTTSNVETFDGLTQGTNYKVRVAGIDPSGNQGPYTTSSAVAPGYVTNTHIVANTITGDRIVAASIDGAKITAGTVNGDRITANTLDANRITTSTLTAADITLAGGSLIAGTPVTADGALLNSQGFKLYKDGAVTVNLDALTGDASFTGNLIGSNIYGGKIESPEITGSVDFGVNAYSNGNFEAGITGWVPTAEGSSNTAISLVTPPATTVDGTNALKIVYDGTGTMSLRATSPNIAVESFDRYNFKLQLKPIGFNMASSGPECWKLNILFYQSDGTTLATYNHTLTAVGEFFFPLVNNGLVSNLSGSFRVPSDAAFVKFSIGQHSSGAASGGWLALTNFVLVDNIVISKDRGITNIQLRAGDGDEGLIVSSDRINDKQMEDRILFARPGDAAPDNQHEYGAIVWKYNAIPTSSTRRHILELTSGGYATTVGAIVNKASLVLMSGTPSTGIADARTTVTTGYFQTYYNTDARITAQTGTSTELYCGLGLIGIYCNGNSVTVNSTGPTANGHPIMTYDTSWQNVTMGSGWSGEGAVTPKARRIGDSVELQGHAVNTGTSPAGTICTLPVGLRPSVTKRMMMGVHQTGVGGAHVCRIDVNTSGTVAVSNYSATIASVTVYLNMTFSLS